MIYPLRTSSDRSSHAAAGPSAPSPTQGSSCAWLWETSFFPKTLRKSKVSFLVILNHSREFGILLQQRGILPLNGLRFAESALLSRQDTLAGQTTSPTSPRAACAPPFAAPRATENINHMRMQVQRAFTHPKKHKRQRKTENKQKYIYIYT